MNVNVSVAGKVRIQVHAGGSSLVADGATERVIYAGTYSKPFATGIRVGFARLPDPLLGSVLNIKGNDDFGSSSSGLAFHIVTP